MTIIKQECGPVATNTYIVFDDTKEAVIIDAPLDSAQIISSIVHEYDLKVKYLLLTHTHWDHTGNASRVVKDTGAKLGVHKEDEYRLKNPSEFSVIPLPFKIDSVQADFLVNEGDKLFFGEQIFYVLHTPGHTEGGICFVESNNKVIFAGDTLFKGSVGRVDMPGGDGNTLDKSIKEKLFVLPDDFTVYCGHGPETTIGEEKSQNPFVGLDSVGLL